MCRWYDEHDMCQAMCIRHNPENPYRYVFRGLGLEVCRPCSDVRKKAQRELGYELQDRGTRVKDLPFHLLYKPGDVGDWLVTPLNPRGCDKWQEHKRSGQYLQHWHHRRYKDYKQVYSRTSQKEYVEQWMQKKDPQAFENWLNQQAAYSQASLRPIPTSVYAPTSTAPAYPQQPYSASATSVAPTVYPQQQQQHLQMPQQSQQSDYSQPGYQQVNQPVQQVYPPQGYQQQEYAQQNPYGITPRGTQQGYPQGNPQGNMHPGNLYPYPAGSQPPIQQQGNQGENQQGNPRENIYQHPAPGSSAGGPNYGGGYQ